MASKFVGYSSQRILSQFGSQTDSTTVLPFARYEVELFLSYFVISTMIKRIKREIKMDFTTINNVSIATIFLIDDPNENNSSESSSSNSDNNSDEKYEDSLNTSQELEILYSILMGETQHGEMKHNMEKQL